MGTLSSTIIVSAKDQTGSALASIATRFGKLAAQIKAVQAGLEVKAPVIGKDAARVLATSATLVQKVGTGFRDNLRQGAHALTMAGAALTPILGLMAHQAEEADKAFNQLQKSFMVTNPNDRSNPDAVDLARVDDEAKRVSLNSTYDLASTREAAAEMRSRNLSTDQVTQNLGKVAALAEIKNENMAKVAEQALAIQRAFGGMTRDAKLFALEFGNTADLIAIQAKRLGLSVEQQEAIAKTAGPATRMLIADPLAALEKQLDEALHHNDEGAADALRQKIADLVRNAQIDTLARTAAIVQGGYAPEEAGNAVKAIYTRGAALPPKAYASMQQNAIDPLSFQVVNPDLFNAKKMHDFMAFHFGDKAAGSMKLYERAFAQQGTWWDKLDIILKDREKAHVFKTAKDRMAFGNTASAFEASSVTSIDTTKLAAALNKPGIPIDLKKNFASLYHIGKAIDMSPQAVAQELEVIAKELAKPDSRLSILKGINEQGFFGAFKATTSKLSVLSDEIGKAIKPDVVEFLGMVSDGIRNLYALGKQNPEGLRRLVLAFAGILAAAPAIYILGELVTAFKALVALPVLTFLVGAWGLYRWLSNMDGVAPAVAAALGDLGAALEELGKGEVYQALGNLGKAGNELFKLNWGAGWSKLSGGEKLAVVIGGVWALTRAFRLLAAGWGVLTAVWGGWAAVSGMVAAGFDAIAIAAAPVLIPLALIAALGVAIYHAWQRMPDLFDGILAAMAEVGQGVKELFSGDFLGGLTHMIDGALRGIEQLSLMIMKSIVVSMVDLLGGDGVQAWNDLTNAIDAGFHKALDWVVGKVEAISAAVKAFADYLGGIVFPTAPAAPTVTPGGVQPGAPVMPEPGDKPYGGRFDDFGNPTDPWPAAPATPGKQSSIPDWNWFGFAKSGAPNGEPVKTEVTGQTTVKVEVSAAPGLVVTKPQDAKVDLKPSASLSTGTNHT